MSSFAKRKPRIIQTFDDDEDDNLTLSSGDQAQQNGNRKSQPENQPRPARKSPPLLILNPQKSDQADALPAEPAPPERIKFGRSKPRASNLRRSIRPDDGDEASEATPAASSTGRGDTGSDGEDDSSGPVVIRPSLGRAGAAKKMKKRPGASRLSFGPGASGEDDNESESSSAAGGTSVIKPSIPAKKSLSQRLLETNALRKSASLESLGAAAGRLPLRFAGGDDDAPKYNKEYLEELQTSTPSTPQNLAALEIHDDHDGDWGAGTPEQQQADASAAADEDEQMLDASELEGAMIVPSSTAGGIIPHSTHQPAAHILTEAEIRERKERRARLARETDFISLEDDESDSGGGARVASIPSRKKKPESRLIAEDEDLGEGYDEFVSDGGLALGRKAEREAKRRHRQEMADLIRAAQGGSDGDDDQNESDSEAERLAAYEAAQQRAGLEGLRRTGGDDGRLPPALDDPDAVPRMKPLPKLNEVLQRMRDLVRGLEDQVAQKRARIGELEREREEILAREKEVQEILDQAGQKYQAAVANVGGGVVDVKRMVSSVGQSPLRPLPPGIVAGEGPVERGLESFGATPTRREDGDDMM
ncbi:hypothetical protein VTJ49DRAFT_2051 [Mycothermus thermophilus]|uniref:Nineteen complex-related protein 2-domain-containing protein n=1 Tax=Humicola insolens TaxID=85995 RepID=A0ABR3VAR5_HUMIN